MLVRGDYMSWMCVGCSSHHEDRLDTMGFGLCKSCSDTAKRVRAEKKAAMFAKRMSVKKSI